MTRPVCDCCGGRPVVKQVKAEGQPGQPAVTLSWCEPCLAAVQGPALNRAAVMLRFLERENRRAHEAYVRDLPGLSRNQRRQLRRELNRDLPELLENAIATHPILDPLRREARP